MKEKENIENNNIDSNLDFETQNLINNIEFDDRNPKIVSLNLVLPGKYIKFINVQPFLFTNYRVNFSIKDCFLSIFSLHNETLNIWTHILATLVHIFLLLRNILIDELSFSDGNLIYLHLIASIICYSISVIYHTINCHSMHVCHCSYMFDLFGVAFVLFASTVGIQHYMFHNHPEIKRIYLTIFSLLVCFTFIISNTEVFEDRIMNLLRIFLYFSLFSIGFLSSLHWIAIGNIHEIEELVKYILLCFIFMFSGFTIFLGKFPESIVQGKYIDLFFHSHIIWHIFVSLSGLMVYLMLYNYQIILIRKFPHYNLK